MAIQLLPLLVSFGMGVGSSVVNLVAEAFVDTSTDFVVDKANEVFERAIPSLSKNQYFNQFTNQIRMGASAATTARVMSKSVQTQQKIEKKIEDMKAQVDTQYKTKLDNLNKTAKHKGALGKRKLSLQKQYNEEIRKIEEDGKRIYKMQDTANHDSGAYLNGTGNLKQGNDGTIQNLKPYPTAQLSKSITDLLNAQGYYDDKSGVVAL